jgi:hypothetical protein
MTRLRLIRFLWLTAPAAFLAGVSDAAAQVLFVRNAPPGTTIEFVLTGTSVGSTVASNTGEATLGTRQNPGARPEVDVTVLVDVCSDRRRVAVVQVGQQPPTQEAACARQEIPGVFVLRPISTLVLNLGSALPTVLLVQGPYDPKAPPRRIGTAPTGFVLSGGAGFTWLGDQALIACGTVANCEGDDSGFGFAGAATFWFLPYLAAEAGYVRPGGMSAEGAGINYRFDSSFDADVVTIAGKAGVPAGPARFYGKFGMNHHWGTFTTNQTVDPRTIVVDGVEQTVPGGTQTLAYQTAGWGWLFGGGGELWASRLFGFYAEFTWTTLKGSDSHGGEAVMDDRVLSIMFGGQLRIGR